MDEEYWSDYNSAPVTTCGCHERDRRYCPAWQSLRLAVNPSKLESKRLAELARETELDRAYWEGKDHG